MVSSYIYFLSHGKQTNLFQSSSYIVFAQEVLRTHKSVFWMDSSIKFVSGNMTDAMKLARSNGGIALFDASGHSIFAATHHRVYDYLPINRQVAMDRHMLGAGAVLMFRSREVRPFSL